MHLTKKLKVIVVSEARDESYSFLRQENYYQNKALTDGMNHLYFNLIAKEKMKLFDESYNTKEANLVEYIYTKKDALNGKLSDKQRGLLNEQIDRGTKKLNLLVKAKNKEVTETFRSIIGFSEQTSLTDYIKSKYDLDSRTTDKIGQIITKDFNNDIKEVLKGDRTLRTYKMTNPIYIRSTTLKLYKEEKNYYFNWIKGIVFKCEIGVKKNDIIKQTSILDKILQGEYKICDSSLEINKKRYMFNLTYDVPYNDIKNKIVGRTLGIDLGIVLTAVAALNDDLNINECFGNLDSVWKTRQQMKKRMSNLQQNISMVEGGKGRDKKLKALHSLSKKEKNFFTNYNHDISNKIVKFAIKHKVEQINLELINIKDINSEILRNWSFGELQRLIEYKALKEGIKVKYIDPYHTSQLCSECGHWEKGQRINQAQFKCKNCDFETNADLNAAINIAKSKTYVNSVEECKKM